MSTRAKTHRNVFTGSAPLDRMQSNVRELVGKVEDVPFLRGKMLRVSFTAGVPRIVAHGLGVPASFLVARVAGGPFAGGDHVDQSVIERHALSTWNSAVFGPVQTEGCSFRLLRHRVIEGVRFAFKSTGASWTVTCKVWDNTTGAQLASTAVAGVSETGVYEARLSAPLTRDYTDRDLTFSVILQSGASYSSHFSSDTTMKGLAPVRLGPDLRLVNQGLFIGADARPTSVAGAGIAWLVEPILSGVPVVAEAPLANLDANTQLGVEASTTCTADLWLYPRVPEVTPR